MTPGFTDVLAFAWTHWRRHPRTLAALALMLMGATLAEVLMPVSIGWLVDALDGGEASAAFRALGLIAAFSVVFHVFHKTGDYIWCGLACRTMRQIGADAFSRVQRYSAEWHANTFAGKTVRNITRGIWAFDDFGDTLYVNLLPAAAVVLGIVLVMTLKWPVMGALFLTGVAIYIAISVAMTAIHVAPRRRLAVEVDSQLGGALADAMTCNAVIKATAAEPREDLRLGGVLERWNHLMVRAWQASVSTSAVQAASLLAVNMVVLGTAIWLWQRGQATPGDVAFVLTSFLTVRGYLRDVGNQIRMLQQATNDLEDVVIYARTPAGIADHPHAVPLDVSAGAVSFAGMRFGYPKQGRYVFEQLDLDIRPGEKVALVGPSGSGKSTLVKLLQRLYELDGGRILIDGQDIARITQASLRGAIALVPQDPVLFHRSLAENIAYARPEASLAEIEHAARLAHADEFIAALPEGYETLVGERGVKLSGGERQRVAIARAILADRPILILDEATSSLDSVSERAIQEALSVLMEGRTTLVVAHRLSTIRRVDRILVFDRGRIVEQGTHDELLRIPGGHYLELFQTQAGDYLADVPSEPARREDAVALPRLA